MSGNGQIAAGPAHVPIIGQPFTVTQAHVPVNMTLACNCVDSRGAAPMEIKLSIAVTCPHCRKMYNAAFNPGTGKIDMLIGLPPTDQVPS